MASLLEQKKSDESALWSFATTVYADAAVAAAALSAQDDAGLDVNLLLFAAWLATLGVTLDHALLQSAEERCGPWRYDVVHPLRRLRRHWKQDAPHDAAYAAIKDLELAAERKQLGFLEALVSQDAIGSVNVEVRALLSANLHALGLHYGADASALTAFEGAVSAALERG